MKHFFIGVLLFSLTSSITAQNSTKDLSSTLRNSLIGTWDGKGTLMGNPATFHMEWSTTLNGAFVYLNFSNAFTDTQGVTRKLTSHGYYHLDNKKGVWIDSRGVILPLILDLASNRLTVVWGNENTEQGKTIYTILKNGMQVEDYVLRNGRYILFGTAEYVRK